MTETDYKNIIPKNIIHYRKAMKLTQADLAERLNYSDKAVSKWERGETVPDVIVLNKMAEIFGISLDRLCSSHSFEKEAPSPVPHITQEKRHLLVSLMSAGLVWLASTVVYVLGSLLLPEFKYTWLIFIYAIPATAIVLIALNAGRKIWLTFILNSVLIWTTALCLFLSVPLDKSVLFFLVAVPMQILALLWFFYLYIKDNQNSNKNVGNPKTKTSVKPKDVILETK